MVEHGIVSRIINGKIIVDIIRHPACSACRLCRKSESQVMSLELENSVNARVGDRVTLHLADGVFLKGAVVVYVFPLMMLFAGLFAGYAIASLMGFYEIRELTAAALGLGLLIASFAAVKKFALISKNKLKPTVSLG